MNTIRRVRSLVGSMNVRMSRSASFKTRMAVLRNRRHQLRNGIASVPGGELTNKLVVGSLFANGVAILRASPDAKFYGQ